jgi:hypothetical protein
MSKHVLTNMDFNGIARILNLPDGVASGQPVTFDQLNAAIEGLAWKDNARVATQGNINLASPGATIDGITMVAGDRVLVKAQSTTSENGVYIWNGAAVAMSRALDGNTAIELENATIVVDEGTNAGTPWRQTQVNFALGSDPVLWSAFSSDTPPASETSAGKIRIATQLETDTGAEDNAAVTPLKLKNSIHAKKKATALIGDGSSTQFDVTHNFGTRDVQVSIYRSTAPYDDVLVDVERPDTNTVRIRFAAAPSSNQYQVVVIG